MGGVDVIIDLKIGDYKVKLEKYEDKSNKKRKIILISLGVVVLISVSLLLYKTFASFMESADFHFMEGKVDYFGNSAIYFVFYEGDKELDEMPKKDSGLTYYRSECTNGASIEWDYDNWEPFVGNLEFGKTKCELFFGETFASSFIKCGNNDKDAVTCFKEYASADSKNLANDNTDDNNIRYIGDAPDNYIDIGDRDSDGQPILWRIIGVMNNVVNLDNEGEKESLIKIIRAHIVGIVVIQILMVVME